MAEVTIELRTVLGMENFKLFDFAYPIVDSNWKKEFEKLFIDHYYFYEIGLETVDRFKHYLKSRLNLVMPYYNELYDTTLFEIDPLITMSIKEDYTDSANMNRDVGIEDNTNSTGSVNNSGSNTDNLIETDYPQTTNIENDIPTMKRKVSAVNSDQTSSNSNTSYSSSIGTGESASKNYEKIIEGFSGNQSEMLKLYRDNIVNINRLLIYEFKDLFILVY